MTESSTGDIWWQALARDPSLRVELLRRVRFLDPQTGLPGMQPKAGHSLWFYSPLGWGPGSRISVGNYVQSGLGNYVQSGLVLPVEKKP